MEFIFSCISRKAVVFYCKDDFVVFRQTIYLPRKQNHTNRRNHVGNQIRTCNMKAKITSWIKWGLCIVLRNQWARNLHLYQDAQNKLLKPNVTISTTRFNIQKLCILPTQCICVFFLWISEQTVFISLYNINLPVFKTEIKSVYCAVRTGSLNATDPFRL